MMRNDIIRETGFSMIEVLIALFLLSVGIMGAGRLLIESMCIQQAALKQEKMTLQTISRVEQQRATFLLGRDTQY